MRTGTQPTRPQEKNKAETPHPGEKKGQADTYNVIRSCGPGERLVIGIQQMRRWLGGRVGRSGWRRTTKGARRQKKDLGGEKKRKGPGDDDDDDDDADPAARLLLGRRSAGLHSSPYGTRRHGVAAGDLRIGCGEGARRFAYDAPGGDTACADTTND
jgi:hypothetical protein